MLFAGWLLLRPPVLGPGAFGNATKCWVVEPHFPVAAGNTKRHSIPAADCERRRAKLVADADAQYGKHKDEVGSSGQALSMEKALARCIPHSTVFARIAATDASTARRVSATEICFVDGMQNTLLHRLEHLHRVRTSRVNELLAKTGSTACGLFARHPASS